VLIRPPAVNIAPECRSHRQTPVIRRILRPARQSLQKFFQFESASGILLLLAAILAIAIVNSPLVELYNALLETKLTVKLGKIGVDKPLLLWINDGLMAVFFLLVGLELKREMLIGQLSDPRSVALPAFCAIGGMAVPALIYAYFNYGNAETLNGWAIPAATDIAFALGVLSVLGSRVPAGLKLLLTAIAVLDDLGAILIIALFYTDDLSGQLLIVAGIAFAALVMLNRLGVTRMTPYILIGLVMWWAVLYSGVHATIAGVALGIAIPLRNRHDPEHSPLLHMEHAIQPWAAYAILPIFAFANAGLPLAGLSLSTLVEPVPMGIALGLLLGKPIGVAGAAFIATLLRISRLPDGVNWSHVFGMALLCGIGFTMSLFIGGLAFVNSVTDYSAEYRLGILSGSTAAALIGAGWLWLGSRQAPRSAEAAT